MLGASLDLRQGQSLVMTPQMRQAIALLQSTNIETAAFLEEQALANPLLELTYDDTIGTGTTDPDEVARLRAEADGGERDPAREIGTIDAGLENGAAPDADRFAQPDHDDAPFDVREGGASGADVAREDMPEAASPGPRLRDRLAEQIAFTFAEPRPRLIAGHLLALLDEAGRLAEAPADIAHALGIDEDEVEAVRRPMMQFDPPGLFAVSLAECLEAQLRARNRFDPAMAALLDHLDLLAARDLSRLRRICGVDQDDLSDMIAELRALDPKPGFDPDHAGIAIVPDVWIKAHGSGFRVAMNGAALPRVRVNDALRARLGRDRAARAYLSECAANAAWVVKSVESRTSSLLAVTRAIVARQDAFLRDGVSSLRPMTLRDIAEATELHESTVSRVTTGKYAATPRGTIALRFFFTVALGDGEGGQSAEAIRHRIRGMIDRETPERILSDYTIAALLQKDGIEIMRRTVAKYREAMGVPTSMQRKRDKRAPR